MPYSVQVTGQTMQSFQSGDDLSEYNNLTKDLNKGKPKLLVQYKEETFDIYDYLVEHPGGRSILEKYEDKDITRAFDDIGHSDFARNKMKQFLVTDKSVHIPTKVTIKGNKIDSKFVIRKLFTKEDSNNIHKILGFASLLSYVYRYCWVYPRTGTLGFTGTAFDWFTFALHFLLSSSSLIFHVVEKRIISNPLIIYQEYRLHAIIFTLRGLLVSVFGLYQHHLTTFQARIALAAMLYTLHAIVDWITMKYGTPGITTVRNDDNGTIPYVKLFFAFYQVLAMSSHVVLDDRLNDLGWNTVIAIQSSGKEMIFTSQFFLSHLLLFLLAFLMTLKRKSLIRARTHFFWYTLALVLSMIYIYHAKGLIHCLVVLGVFYVKVKTNMNKYLMWTLFAFGTYFITDYYSSTASGKNFDLEHLTKSALNLLKLGGISSSTSTEF